jgi:hypothetical protein
MSGQLTEFVDFDRFSAITIDGDNNRSLPIYHSGVQFKGGGDKLPYVGFTESAHSQLGDKSDLPPTWNEI